MKTLDTDVVVIGAGPSGLSAAAAGSGKWNGSCCFGKGSSGGWCC